jgi:hypothetical protein
MNREAAPLSEIDAAVLETIESALASAAEDLLLTERGTMERRLRQKLYVVGLLARVEWDQAHGVPSDRASYTSQLNSLYREGLQAGATRLGHTHEFGEMTASYDQWRSYVRAAIYPAIVLGRNVEPPRSHLELLECLRSGAARFAR